MIKTFALIAVGSAAIAYQATVYCHLDSAAATKPFLIFLIEYVMQ